MEVSGFSAAGFAPVQDAFAQVLAEQPGTGAAMAAWHDGRWVADLWGGRADAADTRRWQADSIVQPYSVSKPFAAVCLLLLVDRGVVELDAPVRRYWPEFRPTATVRHLLSHQAGVVALDRSVPTEVFYDWDALCSMLAEQEPCWEPGSSHGESALFYGHLLGEVSRRVDGRSLGRFLREEVCGPLGLDFQFGLSDAEQGRAVELTGLPEYLSIQRGERQNDLYWRAIDNPPGAHDPNVVNSAAWRAAEIPAINGHGTARGVTGLYVALLNAELLSPALLAEAITVECTGLDAVMGQESSWGLGFGIDSDGFGMGGLGGSWAGASTAGGYAFGFVTGSMGNHDRASRLENTVRTCIGLGPLD